jgi:hypothetical protein
MSNAEKIEVYVREYLQKLNEAECMGVKRARNAIIYIHKHKAQLEADPKKKRWHEEEAKRLADDDQWNTVLEQM